MSTVCERYDSRRQRVRWRDSVLDLSVAAAVISDHAGYNAYPYRTLQGRSTTALKGSTVLREHLGVFSVTIPMTPSNLT
jgi:hypothetical protein